MLIRDLGLPIKKQLGQVGMTHLGHAMPWFVKLGFPCSLDGGRDGLHWS